MAGDLRKGWQDAKKLSFTQFTVKEYPPKGAVHTNAPEPYPLKFKEKLGPALDNWSKAKKPADKDKYKKAALDAITYYRGEIGKAKAMQGKLSGTLLLNELRKIETEVKK